MEDNKAIDNLLNCCINTILNNMEYYENNDKAQKLLEYMEEDNQDNYENN